MAETDSRSGTIPVQLWAILAAGALLRLFYAVYAGLDVDEAYGYFVSRADLGQLLQFVRSDNHPPGYYLLLSFFSGWSRAEWWLRLPNLLAGIAGLALTFQIVRSCLDRSVALWTTALCAVSFPIWVELSRARGYGLFALVFLGLALGWLRERRGSPFPLTVQTLLCLLLASLHLFSLGVFGLLLLGWSRRQSGLRLLPPLLGIALALAWVGYASRYHPEQSMIHYSGAAGGPAVLWNIPFQLSGLPLLAEKWPAAALLATPFSALAWLAGARGAWRLGRQDRRLSLFLLACGLGPAALLGAGCLVRGWGWFQLRFLIAFAPFGLALAIHGLPGRARPWALVPILAVNLAIGLQFPLRHDLALQSWDRVSRFVGWAARPGDILVFYHPYSVVGFNFYYPDGQTRAVLGEPGVFQFQLPAGSWPSQQPVFPERLGPALESALGDAPVVLVLNQEEDPRVRQWFSERYQLVDQLEIRGLNTLGNTSVYRLLPLNRSKP